MSSAPQQSLTPVYKETSNVSRFNTNYHQHDPRKEAGTALARALGVATDVVAKDAKLQKAADLEEGKRLAMMGVERANLHEAATGKGVFSGVGGWVTEGFDMQRGIEDAFIRQSQLIDAFNSSGLSGTDDISAFEAFAAAQRDAIFAELEDAPRFYREGFMEGIAPAFQKMGRSWAGSADTFRTNKKRQAFKERSRTSLITGDDAENRLIVGNAPQAHGITTEEAAGLRAEVAAEEVRKGTVNIDQLDMKQYSKDNQEKILEAAADREEEEQALKKIETMRTRTDLSNLISSAAAGSTEALDKLKADYPDQYQALIRRQANVESYINGETKNQIKELVLNDPTFGSEEMSHDLTSLYMNGELDKVTYNLLDDLNRTQMDTANVMGNPAASAVLSPITMDLSPEQKGRFDTILREEIKRYKQKSNGVDPGPIELRSLAGAVMAAMGVQEMTDDNGTNN